MSVFSKRVVAYIADFFVVSAIMWIFSYVLSLFMDPFELFEVYSYFPFVVPIIIMVYFTLLEKIKGATVGKALMYLEVRDIRDYRITWGQAFARNLTKIYWIPIIFDWAIGKILKKDDRILDSITRTTVIEIPKYY
ncbi:MAG: RDD family protein [Methanobrevibacter sp.]|uniref:RDD family protein n=1 Tax=Methanobrevibacter sp. TaxID=66852 RepID=UPI0026DF065B|nr:RDD family protein [Methanobrevibacter sp.]MDO5848704.1 RDD family protein [Methanobrevibacter sp.]